jgi:Phage gp6-like head-tail connector protein
MTQEFSRVTLPPLWTLAQAKVHLHITDSAHDADVQQKLDTAQEVILSYLAAAADPTWDATTAPKGVKNAIFLLLGHYYEHRGDDMLQAGAGAVDDQLWSAIYRMLGGYRDPVMA